MIFSCGLGIGLSLVFGFLLLALVAKLYYLLWWKKMRVDQTRRIQDNHSNRAKELSYLFCWNKPPSSHNTNNSNSRRQNNTEDITAAAANPEQAINGETSDVEIGASKEFLLKAFESDQEGVESELMRLHNLSGPPRFLFTIKEETKEDLESEDGRSKHCDRSRKGSRTKSLGDLILAVDNPFISPLSSPPLRVSSSTRTTNRDLLDCYSRHKFNPLFESVSAEAELDSWRASPPPKFKFLRDAEEKLYRRLLEEAEKMNRSNGDGNPGSRSSVLEEGGEGKDGSLIKIVAGKSSRHHSSSSQVLPLLSSPTSLRSSSTEKPSRFDQ